MLIILVVDILGGLMHARLPGWLAIVDVDILGGADAGGTSWLAGFSFFICLTLYSDFFLDLLF
jgi:hypothetical protein